MRTIWSLLIFLFLSEHALAEHRVYLNKFKVHGDGADSEFAAWFKGAISRELEQSIDAKLVEDFESASVILSVNLRLREQGYLLALKTKAVKDEGSHLEIGEYDSLSELKDNLSEILGESLERYASSSLNLKSEIPRKSEAGPAKRDEPEGFWYWGMGPGVPQGIKKQEFSQWTIGYAWLYDQQILRLELESASSSDEDMYDIGGFGITWKQLLSQNKTPLFVSATLQRGSYYFDPDGEDGNREPLEYGSYIVGAGFGLLAWTKSSMLIELSLYNRTVLTKVDGQMPGVNGVKVGIYW